MISTAAIIFAVPPFPGASPFPVVRPATSDTTEVSPAALIAALRETGVGGTFWAPGPPADAMAAFAANDPMALLRAVQGVPVTVIGEGAFSALSGLAPGSEAAAQVVEALVARHLLEGIAYHSPFTGERIDALELVGIFAHWKRMIATNAGIAAAFGFARWKQDTVASLLWGGASVPFLPARDALLDRLPPEAGIAVWKARVPPAFLARLEAGPNTLFEVEDGFIRSAGLGADCVPPLSIVLDDLGVHYDPARPNRLEEMIAAGAFASEELARARELREWLVREGVSKYGIGSGTALARAEGGRRHVLVVGQVEDDRSVQFGGGAVQSNAELLRRVRACEQDAYIIYRPHPDVEAGHRNGAIPRRRALELADSIDPGSPIGALIDLVDEVHVITSLAGFEALMRGKSVTTHGVPFFAGWGLTRDLGEVPARRAMARSLDELVAATLLRYPLYLDPVTNLPCPAEVMILRLLTGNRRRNGALVPLRQFFGWMKRATHRFVDMR